MPCTATGCCHVLQALLTLPPSSPSKRCPKASGGRQRLSMAGSPHSRPVEGSCDRPRRRRTHSSAGLPGAVAARHLQQHHISNTTAAAPLQHPALAPPALQSRAAVLPPVQLLPGHVLQFLTGPAALERESCQTRLGFKFEIINSCALCQSHWHDSLLCACMQAWRLLRHIGQLFGAETCWYDYMQA